MSINFYTIHCPKCDVLEKKLNNFPKPLDKRDEIEYNIERVCREHPSALC